MSFRTKGYGFIRQSLFSLSLLEVLYSPLCNNINNKFASFIVLIWLAQDWSRFIHRIDEYIRSHHNHITVSAILFGISVSIDFNRSRTQRKFVYLLILRFCLSTRSYHSHNTFRFGI